MISLNEQGGGLGGAWGLPQQVEEIFSPSGLLSKTKNFEYRPEQQQMAVSIARTLERNEHLAVEAGTGVGKSLAYLIPAVLFGKETERKVVISTHTIALQEQLVYKDIPLVQKVLPVEFEAMLFKGRRNFLCGTRLGRALAASQELFETDERKELERLNTWSRETKNGSLSDFSERPSDRVWDEVVSETGICTPKTCGQNPRCFYQQQRKRLLSADVIVLNHAMFFTLLGDVSYGEDRRGILFADDFVIFDEAHMLESIASQHMGLDVSQYGIRRALMRLYNPKTKKGLLQAAGNGTACAAVAETLPKVDAFFDEVAGKCNFGRGRVFRVREVGLADASPLGEALKSLVETLVITAEQKGGKETLADELKDAANKLRGIHASVTDFMHMEDAEHQVYWVEKHGYQNACGLHASAIDISAVLREALFREGSTCIATSATLSVGGDDLAYFRTRVGAERARAVRIGSPFDFERQMTLHIVKNMPDPKSPNYVRELTHWVKHFTEASKGHAFVLFTSYQTMRDVAEACEEFYMDKDWPFFVQGGGKPPHRMIEEFRENPHSVLFGVDSFWTGVDVPGDALGNVIITRLPFSTPDHPLIQARLESIEAAGGNSFMEYSVPEAILKLRQGVGRLIRTRADKGSIVILDSRIVTKFYGRSFMQSLPQCPTRVYPK